LDSFETDNFIARCVPNTIFDKMASTESTESSRIFVNNLPPNISEVDFRKHFTTKGREITDIKLIPKRRIGYVGFKTPEDAAKAVKYFNRSYIRMSRISVEVARPVSPLHIPAFQRTRH
jgi:multiple RNA-binding domain-containing protein 1